MATVVPVLVSIVNYRTPRLALACLASLRAQLRELGGRAIVADNASGDDSLPLLREAVTRCHDEDWAEVLAVGHNGGFASGNNAVLRHAQARGLRPRYVLLLNPDTEVRPGAIAALLEFMDARPEVGIAGCRAEDADGSPRRSAFRFHSALGDLEAEARFGPLSRLLSRWKVAPPPRDEPHRVDWVTGAAMLVRREVFERIGLLDEGFFLYYEETDFCRRAADAGFECWHVPASRVLHLCGQSTGVTGARRNERAVPRYWFESRRRYFLKHHGPTYTTLADLAWLAGGALRKLRGRDDGPPRRYGDFVSYNLAMRADEARKHPDPEFGRHDRNPEGMGLLALVREDFRTHDRDPFEPGFWAVAVHRFGNWRMGVRSRLVRAPLTAAYRLASRAVHWGFGIKLDYTVRLGRRVRIWHHGGMVLGASSIGDDVHIRQNTTFGVARRDRPFEKPTIGDRVDIGCGAVILGGVTVGDDSVIGANAVVIRDVPCSALAVGVPARVVERRGDAPRAGSGPAPRVDDRPDHVALERLHQALAEAGRQRPPAVVPPAMARLDPVGSMHDRGGEELAGVADVLHEQEAQR